MRGKLSTARSNSLISPLIDVIFNAMAAMFVFLVIYIAVVRPGHDLEIVNTVPPDAVWYKRYEWGLSVRGGQGRFTFNVVDGELPKELLLNPNTGVLLGVPKSNPGMEKKPKTFPFTILVRDDASNTVRRQFELKVCPVAIPFDPESQPLEFVAKGTRFQDAWTGQHYEATAPVRGGIEPYMIECKNLPPPGLYWDKGRISGFPEDSAIPRGGLYKDYSILITVNDQQRAYSLDVDREPQLSREFHLCVHRLENISLTSVLPTARVGQRYKGAIVAKGGKQRLIWQSKDLDHLRSHGFTLEPYSGLITAESVKTSDVTRVVRVSFQVHVTDPSGAVEPKSIKDAIQILPSMHFRIPD